MCYNLYIIGPPFQAALLTELGLDANVADAQIVAAGDGESVGKKAIYIYIYIERERYVYLSISIYIYICICMHIYVYIYIYVWPGMP